MTDHHIDAKTSPFVAVEGQLALQLDSCHQHALTPWAIGQVASRFGMQPYVLLSNLDADFAVKLLNRLAQKRNSTDFTVRELDGVIRAYLSRRYVVVDDRQMLDALFSWAGKSGWNLGEVESMPYRERMLVRAERHPEDSDAPILAKAKAECFGLVVTNSEVGAAYPAAAPALVFQDGALCIFSAMAPRARLRSRDLAKSLEGMISEAAWRLGSVQYLIDELSHQRVTRFLLRSVGDVVRREKLYDVESDIMAAAHTVAGGGASVLDVVRAIAEQSIGAPLPQRIRIASAAGALATSVGSSRRR